MIKNPFTIIACLAMLLCCVSCTSNKPKERTLHVHVEDIVFDSIRVVAATDIYNRLTVTSIDNVNWDVHIPDSIFSESWFYAIYAYTGGISKPVRFSSDSIQMGTIHFMEPNDYDIQLNIKLLDENYVSASGSTGVLMEVMKGSSQDIPIGAQYMRAYTDAGPENWTYEEMLSKFASLTEKYPDSYITLHYLSSQIRHWLKAEDGFMLYNLMSKRLRETEKGKGMLDYFERKQAFSSFDNISLPNGDTGIPEPIMTDTGKYNLVIFSASWCGACRAMTPLLKEIYSDLSAGLDMAYITNDEEKDMETWRKLIEEDEIPWRHLWTGYDPDVTEKYFVRAYPTLYLIHPGGEFETINPREEADKNKLYGLVL